MSEFSSMGALALHFATLHATELACLEHGLEQCARRLEETMRTEVGHYQDSIGPFPEWAELTDVTEETKARNGFPADSPLLARGDLQGSFAYERHGLEVVVGSTDRKMVYHEFGTPRIPPRPVVGPAVLRTREYIRRTIGHAMVEGLVGGRAIHRALGYSREV